MPEKEFPNSHIDQTGEAFSLRELAPDYATMYKNITALLDQTAELAKLWTKYRLNDIDPKGVRAGLISLAQELTEAQSNWK